MAPRDTDAPTVRCTGCVDGSQMPYSAKDCPACHGTTRVPALVPAREAQDAAKDAAKDAKDERRAAQQHFKIVIRD